MRSVKGRDTSNGLLEERLEGKALRTVMGVGAANANLEAAHGHLAGMAVNNRHARAGV
jgi:hypothetical protein